MGNIKIRLWKYFHQLLVKSLGELVWSLFEKKGMRKSWWLTFFLLLFINGITLYRAIICRTSLLIIVVCNRCRWKNKAKMFNKRYSNVYVSEECQTATCMYCVMVNKIWGKIMMFRSHCWLPWWSYHTPDLFWTTFFIPYMRS